MLHTGVDRQLRVFGHDLQNRGWTQIRVPQHSRDPLERHRASTYLSVVKLVQRGVCSVHERQMIARQPELRRQLTELQGGIGMAGGPRNPLGARAMYLWQGNKDTLYRIHGTFEPWTIGKNVSSGCIRMINQDVIDLYQRTAAGARVVVLASRS